MSNRDEAKTLRIDIDEGAKVKFTSAHKHYGLSQREAVTRLVLWWSTQNEIVQTLVMDTLPKALKSEALRQALQAIKKRSQSAGSGADLADEDEGDAGEDSQRRKKPG